MATHSPLPWRVKRGTFGHYKGSPLCDETCGKGDIPVSVYESKEAWGAHGEREVHDFVDDSVEDVIAADERHVVCTGHDYDEGGSVSVDDAEFIVRACNNHEALLAALEFAASAYCSEHCGERHDDRCQSLRAVIAAAEAGH